MRDQWMLPNKETPRWLAAIRSRPGRAIGVVSNATDDATWKVARFSTGDITDTLPRLWMIFSEEYDF